MMNVFIVHELTRRDVRCAVETGIISLRYVTSLNQGFGSSFQDDKAAHNMRNAFLGALHLKTHFAM